MPASRPSSQPTQHAPAGLVALMALVALSAWTPADALEQIDDTTAFDAASGVYVHHSTATPSDGLGAIDESPGDLSRAANPPLGAAAALTDGTVGCSTTDSANPFDLVTNAQPPSIDLLPEGNYPYDATINFDGTETWIPGASGDGVIVLDRATNSIAQRITVGDYPISVVFTKNGERALVSNRTSRDISIISTTTYSVMSTLDLGITSGFGPGNMALDPTTGEIWAVRYFEDDLYRIAPDGSSLLDTYPIGNSLWQVVVSPDGQYVYCTDRNTDEVHVFDPVTELVVTSVGVGDDPWGLDVTGDGAQVVVTCEDDATVHVINTTTFLASPINLPATADPRDVDILDATNTAYVCGGTVTGEGSPIYLIDLESFEIEDSFASLGTNTNVVAVQPQMGGVTTAVDVEMVPNAVGLSLDARPNPFNPRTTVAYALERAATVELSVFTPSGRLVTVLAEGQQTAGVHTVSWDGRRANGDLVAGGVYLLRLDTGSESQTLKVVLAK